MPRCQAVTCGSEKAKSQVSPSGGPHHPGTRLGAITGPFQLSLSIFIAVWIRPVLKESASSPADTFIITAAKWPFGNI